MMLMMPDYVAESARKLGFRPFRRYILHPLALLFSLPLIVILLDAENLDSALYDDVELVSVVTLVEDIVSLKSELIL